jgi:hypothetical protein
MNIEPVSLMDELMKYYNTKSSLGANLLNSAAGGAGSLLGNLMSNQIEGGIDNTQRYTGGEKQNRAMYGTLGSILGGTAGSAIAPALAATGPIGVGAGALVSALMSLLGKSAGKAAGSKKGSWLESLFG